MSDKIDNRPPFRLFFKTGDLFPPAGPISPRESKKTNTARLKSKSVARKTTIRTTVIGPGDDEVLSTSRETYPANVLDTLEKMEKLQNEKKLAEELHKEKIRALEERRKSDEKAFQKKLNTLEDQLKDYRCKICLDRPAKYMFLPCRHASICRECLVTANMVKCPICRTKIESKAEVYFS